MSKQRYVSGYTDFTREVADAIRSAHHLRYIRTPEGRLLYLIGSIDADTDEIAEIKFVTAAANAALLARKERM